MSELPISCIGYTIQSLKKKYNLSIYDKSELFTEGTTSSKSGENNYKNSNFFYISKDKNNNTIAINIKNDCIQSLSKFEINIYQQEIRNSPPTDSPTRRGIYNRNDILAMEYQTKILAITREYTLYVKNTKQEFLDNIYQNMYPHCYLRPFEKNQVVIELHQSLRNTINKIYVLKWSVLNINFESDYNNKNDTVEIDEYTRFIQRISEKSIYFSFSRIIPTPEKNEIIYEDYLLTFHYTWKVIRLIWLGFLKKNGDNDNNNNNNNSFCYFSVLPKDLIKIIISFLHHMVFLS
jgi:hypothetical protein